MMVTVAIMALMIAEPQLVYYITEAQIKHKKISSAWREKKGVKNYHQICFFPQAADYAAQRTEIWRNWDLRQ